MGSHTLLSAASLVSAFVGVAMLTGCSCDGEGNVTSDGGMVFGSDSAQPPTDCSAQDVARFSGTVVSLAGATPIAGAQVCVLGHPEIPCAQTDAGGNYALGCAPTGDAAITFTATGHASAIWLWRGNPGIDFDLDLALARDVDNESYFASVGQTYPRADRAMVTVVFEEGSEAMGLTGSVSGAGEGPFFSMNMGATLDPAASSLPADDELMVFLVDPSAGEVELTLAPPAGATCTQLEGAWAGSGPDTVRVPVIAGWESVIWIRCDR